jgi:uncharacterized protein YjbI with pentapeptide repeats
MDLSGKDLRDKDLRDKDLRGANLSRADLRRADLSGASLRYANLCRADLSRANLRRADLTGADLNKASLSGADLSRANLRRADLSGADLSWASLHGASLHGAVLPEISIPTIADIHTKVYDAARSAGALNMLAWHTCETTHCWAGWTVHLAGEPGRVLECEVGTNAAAALIYAKSDLDLAHIPDFFTSEREALADMKRLAE